jgi:hypothetical protein
MPSAPKQAAGDDGLINPSPAMGVGGIDAAELGEVITALQLQAGGQRTGGQECLFQFDLILQQDDVGLARKELIHHAGEGQFRLLQGEAALVRVVPAPLQFAQFVVADTGATGGHQNVHR